MCVHNLLRFREVREVAAYWEECAGTPSIIIAQTAHDDKADHYVGSLILDMAVAVIGAESILPACAIGCRDKGAADERGTSVAVAQTTASVRISPMTTLYDLCWPVSP